VTGDSGRAVWLEQARSYLRGADPVLARLIDARPDFDPRAWLARLPPMDLFGALLFQVIGQQLSVAATRRTLARIGALFDGHLPAPAGLLAVDPAKLREAGLSWRKIGTLREVAERLSDGRLDQAALSQPVRPWLPAGRRQPSHWARSQALAVHRRAYGASALRMVAARPRPLEPSASMSGL